MASVIRLQSSYLMKRIIPALNQRGISTSKKNSETATIATKQAKTEPATITTNKNWVIGLGFAWAYIPDYNLRDWAQREAFLELRRREAQGLPLVDPNLIDPSKIVLPSDSELGDTEIIV
ncbi:nadh-ubiquinone oxidoreductase esss subunit mitochondrial precursor [Holotrichia oblita]|uniref:Nadh-ubiquinone oxidoreductase esss subunit mitochondrial n=1 Tax=Holotrichia oblita TaxID=644536 RepID=A0ACB9T1B5_HOLOL|nr:nadh-ubiquinone oxidoreductase esss subunit mitochondrial precursor [Holotrichia oblita]